MSEPVSLANLLGSQAILADLAVEGKKQLLQDLARHAAGALGLEDHDVFDVLWEREKLGTTGIGSGIAIPHGRLEGLKNVCGFFARLASPIAFDSVDDRPVDIVFLLLAPEDAGADHLHALAAVSRTLRDNVFCDKLRKARDVAALGNLLSKTVVPAAA